MKKLLLTITLGLLTLTAHANQRAPFPPEACRVFTPYGPITTTKLLDTTHICRQGYFTLHDNVAKIPVWTIWSVSPKHVNGCVPRSNAFATDQSLLPGHRATPDDYIGAGYDQGHIANASHQSWDVTVERESFLMSNIVPQLPGLNRGIWKLLETSTGAWTYSTQHTMLVYAGPIYDVNVADKIGKVNVTVPTAFFKIVIDTNTGATLAFIFPHAERQGNNLTKVQYTVADVEKATGLIFSIPIGHRKTAKEQIFPTDFKSVAAEKKRLCGKAAD